MGDTLRTKTVPMPTRTYDVATLFYVKSMEDRFDTPFQDRTKDSLLDDKNHDEVTELLTAAIMFCTTGRVYAFHAFKEWMQKNYPNECEDGAFLPSASTVERACEFLIPTSWKDTEKVTDWTSGQYGSALPEEWKNEAGLKSLWKLVAQDSGKIVECIVELVKDEDATDSRENVLQYLCSYLDGTGVHNNDWVEEKGPFVAHAILATIEDVSNEMFGEVNTVHFWYGSKEGLVGIKNGMFQARAQSDPTSKKPPKKPMTKEALNVVLDEIYEFSDLQLSVLGWYKDSNSIIRVKRTHKKVGFTEVEHILCKLGKLKSHTHPNRVVNSGKPDCAFNHPVPYKSHKWSEKTLKIFRAMAES